jgi:hypothetical protein
VVAGDGAPADLAGERVEEVVGAGAVEPLRNPRAHALAVGASRVVEAEPTLERELREADEQLFALLVEVG